MARGPEMSRRNFLMGLAAAGAVEIIGSPKPLPEGSVPIEPTPPPLIRGRGRIYTHGSRYEEDIFFSVDDGWDEKNMQAALHTADKYKIPLTFFPAGIAMEKGTGEVYREIFARGHAIENHTYKHDLALITRDTPKKAIVDEIKAQQEVVYEILKPKTPDEIRRITQRFFRPPGGNGVEWDEDGRGIRKPFPNLVEACQDMQLDIATWDIDSDDWKEGADPYHNVIQQIDNSDYDGRGSFVLTHALDKEREALPKMIDNVQKRGLKPASMRDLP